MRLFIGCPVPCPPSLVARAVALGGRASDPATWHVTLRFLGDAEPEPVIEAMSAVGRVSAFDASIEGIGAFPSKQRARVAWTHARGDGWAPLAAALAHATGHLGEPVPTRPFVPHATLARLPRPTDLRDQAVDDAWATWRVEEVVLFESILDPRGAVHRPVHRQRLAEA